MPPIYFYLALPLLGICVLLLLGIFIGYWLGRSNPASPKTRNSPPNQGRPTSDGLTRPPATPCTMPGRARKIDNLFHGSAIHSQLVPKPAWDLPEPSDPLPMAASLRPRSRD